MRVAFFCFLCLMSTFCAPVRTRLARKPLPSAPFHRTRKQWDLRVQDLMWFADSYGDDAGAGSSKDQESERPLKRARHGVKKPHLALDPKPITQSDGVAVEPSVLRIIYKDVQTMIDLRNVVHDEDPSEPFDPKGDRGKMLLYCQALATRALPYSLYEAVINSRLLVVDSNQ